MLKNLGYDGAYHDENMSVSVLLENPLEYNLEASTLVFSIALRSKNGSKILRLEDFAFYVMDETNRLYNTQSTPYSKSTNGVIAEDDEPVRCSSGLLHTDFKYDFLFQDLRIAFYYRPDMKFSIIKLKH